MALHAQPYRHPSVWHGPQIAGSTDWILRLDDADIAEIDAALKAVKARGLTIPGIGKQDFIAPKVAGKMNQVRAELEDGRGFVLLRGFPVQRYSKSDAAIIYWSLGAMMGPAFAQNAQGDMLGHVRDLGVDSRTNMSARGYQTRLHLPFHNDSTDVVGLLCLHPAKSGGASRIVSSTAVYNAFLERRPDLWQVMCEPFQVDRRNEESAGQKPYYVTPCFNHHEGRLFVRYNRTFIESAQRHPDVPRLSAAQREALDLMDALCNDPEFYLDMQFEPGDMQFICNYTTLHSRSEYEDWPEPERKRHLLRLWLRTAGFARLPPAFEDRNADMIAWQRTPRAPIFDVSEIAAELTH